MKTMNLIRIIFVLSLCVFFSVSAQVKQINPVLDLQHKWAIANYQLEGEAQNKTFKLLVKEAKNTLIQYPDNAEVYVWVGIIQSTYAGVKGGLGALSIAKEAKKNLEKSIKLNPMALNGSAYNSLAVLYHNVPGWPIGFGSDNKAQKLFQKALSIAPKNIDNNYFYAQYLISEKKLDSAKKHLLIALQAKSRVGRELADKGRKNEVNLLLTALEKK